MKRKTEKAIFMAAAIIALISAIMLPALAHEENKTGQSPAEISAKAAVIIGIALSIILWAKEKRGVKEKKAATKKLISDPPLAEKLFSNTKWSIIWLPARLYLGYTWLSSGLGKAANSAWLSGEALKGFLTNAAGTTAAGKPVIAYGFYRNFIQTILSTGQTEPFAKAIMASEILIGIALILGAFTGIAAFIGAFMNWNFMMAGTASINPLMFLLSMLLIIAWKTAGYTGLDRWLLPRLGTPWKK